MNGIILISHHISATTLLIGCHIKTNPSVNSSVLGFQRGFKKIYENEGGILLFLATSS